MIGVQGGMSWQFKSLSKNETTRIHKYQLVGFLPDGLDKLAKIFDKVQATQARQAHYKLNL